MPVSAGLQKYFDSQKKKKGDIKQKLDTLSSQIDPVFMQSFRDFHDRILQIVDENPELESEVTGDLDDLEKEMFTAKSRYNLKKSAIIIEKSEK